MSLPAPSQRLSLEQFLEMEYALVSQDCMDVRVYRRTESGWTASIYTDGAEVPFESVDLRVPIERIYEEAWD